MLIFKFGDGAAQFEVEFRTDVNTGRPYFYFPQGSGRTLPFEEARKLARKILWMPTPLDFKETT